MNVLDSIEPNNIRFHRPSRSSGTYEAKDSTHWTMNIELEGHWTFEIDPGGFIASAERAVVSVEDKELVATFSERQRVLEGAELESAPSIL
jgi:hypothetical protein